MAFFVTVGANITPLAVARTVANYAGGRLGLGVEKYVVEVCTGEHAPAV